MRVVFVHPDQIGFEKIPFNYKNIVSRKRLKKRIAPYGLLSLYENSYYPSVFIDNFIINLSNEDLCQYCLDSIGHQKGVVAFGGTFLENPQAVVVSRLIKQARPDIITIYGGPNATARPDKHIKDFDYVIIGPGIFLFNQVIQDMPDKRIQGPCYDKILDNKWPGIPKSYKFSYLTNSILSSIGCPFSCRFCSSKYIWNKKVFFRDPDSVLSEISELKGIIEFRDDNFTINKDRLLYFCKALKKMNKQWTCQARVSSLNIDLIRTMKESGCILISCGFESVSDSTLSFINKGHTVDQMVNLINDFEKSQMYYTGGFVVGFPNEDKQDIKQTIKFARKKRKFSKIPIDVSVFLGMPVSELYYLIREENLVEYSWNDGELLFPGTRHLSRKSVEKLVELK